MRNSSLARRAIGALLAMSLAAVAVSGIPADAQPDSAQAEAVSRDGQTANAVNEDVGRIERAYITLLGRQPDAGGLRYWLAQQANGLSYEAIVQIFLGSVERMAKYPASQTNEEFLVQLYTDAFGRPPDSGGQAYWVGILDGGTSRTDVALFFADSAEQRNNTAPNAVFDLNIFHINDPHSNLNPNSIEFTLGGVTTETELGGYPRVVAKMDELDAKYSDGNNLKLLGGDALTGTLFYTLFQGEADAALMNQVCFDAMAVGNHEFDAGDAGLVKFLDFLSTPECDTAIISANVEPALGTPLNPSDGEPYILPFVIKDFGATNGTASATDGSSPAVDQRVGIIGLSIAQKTRVSSSPLDTTIFLDEVESTQRYVDELEAMGVTKIVLVTHNGYERDLALAKMVTGVDLIVSGDTHTLLGEFGDIGLGSAGPYPTKTTDKSGLPVCVVQAWQYTAVVGEFNASFDEFGHVVECGGQSNLLLGNGFTKEVNDETVDLTAEELAIVMAELDKIPSAGTVTPDADALAVLQTFSDQVAVLELEVIGSATADLCSGRIPGDVGRTVIPGCVAGGLPNGGDIQQLVAYAFADRAFDADFALQNSGGVRIDIPFGEITIADAYELLPFANTMVNLEMTGAEVVQSLEDGVSNIVDEGGSSGAYPYGAYLRWDADLSQPKGQRFSNVEIRAKADGSAWGPIDLAATYTVVVNSFMAGGGDGFVTLEAVADSGRAVDTLIDYAQGFIDYVREDLAGSVGRVPIEDYSTQNFTPAPD